MSWICVTFHVESGLVDFHVVDLTIKGTLSGLPQGTSPPNGSYFIHKIGIFLVRPLFELVIVGNGLLHLAGHFVSAVTLSDGTFLSY